MAKEAQQIERKKIKELMKRLSKGDKAAYDELYANHKIDVYRFINSIVKCSHDAEDITQIVFTKLLEKSFRFTILRDGAAYLFQIAVNCCNDYFKEKKLRNQFIFDLEVQQNIAITTNCEEYDIDALFYKLTPIEKQLVILRYQKGYNLSEIAKMTDIPKRTLNRKYVKILDQIRANIEEK